MKKIIFACAIWSMLLTACAENDKQANMQQEEQVPLQIDETTLPDVITKATVTTLNTLNDSLGLFCIAGNGYTAKSNVKYTYNSWWTSTTPLSLTANAASVCAYYPYRAAGITNTTNPTSVALTSQKYTAAQDLCYATTVSTAKSTAPNVKFAMKRAYAKLTITIIHIVSYAGACNIDKISIINMGLLTKNTLNITTGAYGTPTADEVSYNSEIASIAPRDSVTTAALMVPVTTAMKGQIKLVLRIDGIPKEVSFTPLSPYTFVAGTNYKVTLAISDIARLSIITTGVTDWTEKTLPEITI